MRRRTPRISAVLLMSLALLAACGPGDSAQPDPTGGRSESRDGRTDPGIAKVLDRAWPEGASGSVVAGRGGEMVHCGSFAWADRARRVRADCDTAYDIMSMTKSFTAVAVLKLESEGKLRVSDRLSAYLDDVPEDKRSITLHQLLTHTSGLPEALGDDYAPVSRREMMDGALRAKLVASPGIRFSYSNLGYSLLAALVEKVSGIDYEHYLAAKIFKPAGMTDTGYVLPRWRPDQVAVEYDDHGRARGRPTDHRWASDGPYWNLRGNGGLLSTSRDMYRFHHALTAGTVLDKPARTKMQRPYVPLGLPGFGGYGVGYGWVISPDKGRRIATHSGGNDWSYGVHARGVDDDVMAFWITNQTARQGKWNLQEQGKSLTLNLIKSLR